VTPIVTDASEYTPPLPAGLVPQAALRGGALNLPAVRCHFLAAIPALLTIDSVRLGFAHLPSDEGLLAFVREVAAERLDPDEPVVLVGLEQKLEDFGVFPGGWFSSNRDPVDTIARLLASVVDTGDEGKDVAALFTAK
jgi:hypothetical protein